MIRTTYASATDSNHLRLGVAVGYDTRIPELSAHHISSLSIPKHHPGMSTRISGSSLANPVLVRILAVT